MNIEPTYTKQHQHVVRTIEDIATSYRNAPVKMGRFLWRYERNKEDLEDIVQEALLAALECSEKFQNKSSVKSWLLGIMLNVARHHVAVRASETRHRNECINHKSLDESFNFFGTNPEPCPSKNLEFRELSEAISVVLSAMSPEVRHTFELVCIHEKPYQEVAEIMDVPIGTVRSRINRVRLSLRSLIQTYEGNTQKQTACEE